MKTEIYYKREIILNKLKALNDKLSILVVRKEDSGALIVSVCNKFSQNYAQELKDSNGAYDTLIERTENEFVELLNQLN